MATIIEGKRIQQTLLIDLVSRIDKLKAEKSVTPSLALIMIEGDDPMAKINFRLHTSLAEALQLNVNEVILPLGTTEEEVIEVIHRFNQDENIHSILVLMPVPKEMKIQNIINAIHPDKEIEGLHPENATSLFPTSNQSIKYQMCVPTAVHYLLNSLEDPYENANYVVAIDKDLEETNPVAKMVARIGTVTMAPKGAKSIKFINMEADDIVDHCKEADVLVISTQKPKVVTEEWVKPGACVIDFNPIFEGLKPHPKLANQFIPILTGGVDVESVKKKAKYIAPVPGGVGPVMLAALFQNVYLAAHKATNHKELVQM